MTDSLTLGWSAARAEGRKSVYQKTLGFNMLLHLLIGLGCMFTPHLVSQTFGLPEPVPTGWIRGWGATLILVTALYVPGLQDPLRSRAANIIGISGAFGWRPSGFASGASPARAASSGSAFSTSPSRSSWLGSITGIAWRN